MTITYCDIQVSPGAYVKALEDYIQEHGYPPPPTETIDIHVEGGRVVVKFVTLKETA